MTEEKPFLSFLAIVIAVVGVFYVVRKCGGTLLALIVAYLTYVYRKDWMSGIGELFHGRD
jgi:hypothetical protein